MAQGFDRRLLPVERLVWESPSVRLGLFRCPVDHPLFSDSGPILNHVFVFPRTSVGLRHEGARPFVAGPNVITLYNRGAIYERMKVDPEGDSCDWIQIEDATLRETVAAFDPQSAERSHAPFRFTHMASPASVYLRQRRLFRYAGSHPAPDALRVEEEAVSILGQVLAAGSPGAQPELNRPRSRDLAEDAKALIGRRRGRPIALDAMARALSVSVFHLCRSFRAVSGFTIHEYAHQLRLRRVLEELEKGSEDLLAVALDADYSSHSHFTAAFRRRFGITPSALRREFGGGLRESKAEC